MHLVYFRVFAVFWWNGHTFTHLCCFSRGSRLGFTSGGDFGAQNEVADESDKKRRSRKIPSGTLFRVLHGRVMVYACHYTGRVTGADRC